MEVPHALSLPGGILVSSCLISLPAKGNCLPTGLKNEIEHNVDLPPRIWLAEVNSIQSVMPKDQNAVLTSSSVNQTKSPEDSKIDFNFNNSPLIPEWKEIVTRKLNSMHKVFACHDLDLWSHHQDQTPYPITQ